nr:IclR family transcriptional regulator [Spelaeicoccus albus]
MSVREISALTGIPQSAVYRKLDALVDAGLVNRGPRRGQFCCGAESLRFAESYRREALANSPITTHLRRAAESSGELAAYLIPSGTEALCVESAEGRHILRCSYSPGRAQPLTRGASALAILAFLQPADARDILAALHVQSSGKQALFRQLEQVRAHRYAMSDSELDEGVWGASAPVFSGSGNLTGVVTIMAPSVRAEQRQDELISQAQLTAADLTSALEPT